MQNIGWKEITKNEYLHPSPPDPPNDEVSKTLTSLRLKGYEELRWNQNNRSYFLLNFNSIRSVTGHNDSLFFEIAAVPFFGSGDFNIESYCVVPSEFKYKLSRKVVDDINPNLKYEKDSILAQYLDFIETKKIIANNVVDSKTQKLTDRINEHRNNGYTQLSYGPKIGTYFMIDPESITIGPKLISFKLLEIKESSLKENEIYYIVEPAIMSFIGFNYVENLSYENYKPNQQYNSDSILAQYIKLLKK